VRSIAFENGSFASLARLDARVFVCFQTDPRSPESQVKVYDLATEQLVFSKVIGGGAAFPLVHTYKGRCYVAWRRGDTGMLCIDTIDGWLIASVGLAHGNEPFAFEGGYIYWQSDNYRVVRSPLDSLGPIELLPYVGRGTGLSRVVNGVPIVRDEDRIYRGLTFPSYAPGYVACEGAVSGIVVFREHDDFEARPWKGLDCFVPKILDDGQGVIVATSGSGSVRAAVLQAHDFERPVVLPPPPPPPDLPPPAPPETTMRIPDPVFDTIAAVYDKFGLPEGEEAQRALQEKVCQTVAARHGSQWGWKRASGPPSTDAVAWRESVNAGSFLVWDCVRDAGGPGRTFSLARGAEGELVHGQTFIVVQAIDHLAGSTPPPLPPPDPPPTGGGEASGRDYTPLIDEIEGLQRATVLALGQMQATLDKVAMWIERGGAPAPSDMLPVIAELQKLNATATELKDAALGGRLSVRVRFS
jgi:hypothetical protein